MHFNPLSTSTEMRRGSKQSFLNIPTYSISPKYAEKNMPNSYLSRYECKKS